MKKHLFNRITERFLQSKEEVCIELDWVSEHALSINLPAQIHWQPATSARARIRGQAELIKQVSLEGGQLGGKVEWSFFRDNAIHIELESPAIEKWQVNGSAQLYLHHVAQSAIQLELIGSGEIRAAGTTENVQVRIVGSGDVDIGMLTQTNTTVQIKGSGDAVIAPTGNADLTLEGSGDVTLLRQPLTLVSNKTSNADVRVV